MRLAGLLALLCAAVPVVGAAAEAGPPLVLEATIMLEHTRGRIDHMAVDLRRRRLFVAELGNGTVDVADLERGNVTARIDGLREPQGVGYANQADLVVVASAGDGTVRFYRGDDLRPTGVVSLGDDADNVRIDPKSGNVVVGYGSGGLAIIDPVTRTKIVDVTLPAHPEGFQLDPATNRAFINLPDARQISVIDLSTRQTVAVWRVSGALGNFPMAFDGNAVALVTRSPPELIVLNAADGRPEARKPSCGDPDDVFFDRQRHRIYVSCGSGQVDTWQQDGPGYRPLVPTMTGSGARTALFVPELDRLFVAERAGLLGSSATLRVYKPVD